MWRPCGVLDDVYQKDMAIIRTWQQWSIYLADLSNVNLTEINSMTIMIGDDATEERGQGVLYIDDICLH